MPVNGDKEAPFGFKGVRGAQQARQAWLGASKDRDAGKAGK